MAEDVFGIVGTTQGQFTVERVVAQGGFGVVYRAYHGAFRAPVALKCLKLPASVPEHLRARFLEQFREEAEMLFRLSAAIPAVVRPLHHDVISTASGLFVPFIALEWLEGVTLAAFVAHRAARREAPLGLADAAKLLAPVARAVEAAHAFPGPSGPICVVHRDIKPANIFLSELHGSQVVKILDFGIARARDAASVIAGEVSTTAGNAPDAFTPRYGAPEQWAPRRFGKAGPWTDVWALALTYLEVVAGRPIIDGDPMGMMGTVLDERRRPTPRAEGIAVPDAIEALFTRALALDPRARLADAGVFWDELERALDLPPSARPIPLTARVAHHAVRPALGSSPDSTLPSANAPTALADPPPPAARIVDLVSEGSATLLDAPPPAPPKPAGAAGPKPAGATGPNTLPSNQARPPGPARPRPPQPSRPRPPQPSRPAAASPRPVGLPRRMELDWDPELEAHRHDQSPHRPVTPHVRVAPPRPAPAAELKAVFGLPLRLAGAGVAVSLVDQALATFVFHGDRIGLGPIRLLWVAAALVLVGLAIAAWRLLGQSR